MKFIPPPLQQRQYIFYWLKASQKYLRFRLSTFEQYTTKIINQILEMTSYLCLKIRFFSLRLRFQHVFFRLHMKKTLSLPIRLVIETPKHFRFISFLLLKIAKLSSDSFIAIQIITKIPNNRVYNLNKGLINVWSWENSFSSFQPFW